MKKTLVAVLVAGAISFAGVSARAQGSTDPGIVKVPFSFIVGERLLPAGTYRIASQVGDPTLLLVSSEDGRAQGAFTSTQWTGIPVPSGQKVRVAFKNFDGQYFLWQVGMPGQDTREVALTKSAAERTLARLNLMPAERGDTVTK